MFVDAWTYLVEHPRQFGVALWTHVTLSAAALAIAVVIAVPLGIWLAETRRAALVAINAANIGRTLPSLAVLALMMPILGTGFAPALFALTLLALPPILLNTCTAIRQVDADIVDACARHGHDSGGARPQGQVADRNAGYLCRYSHFRDPGHFRCRACELYWRWRSR
jgi:osmoprotectant transport system permease protein